MKNLFVAAALIVSPATAQDWNAPAFQSTADKNLRWLADSCADYGFDARKLPPSETRNKLKAHLLLDSDPVELLRSWSRALDAFFTDEKAVGDRLLQAIAAAKADPSRTAEARKLFISTFVDSRREGLVQCERMSSVPFINANYLYGEGNLNHVTKVAEEAFEAKMQEKING